MPVKQILAGIFMGKSSFNPEQQEQSTSSKIVAGLERITEAFKVLLWNKAKELGLSPIQIQILIFVTYHKSDLCNVSHLAKEFNVTKPTISDAVRVLEKKQLIIKDYSSADNRSYTILLSEKGKNSVAQTEDFGEPIKQQIDAMDANATESMFESLSKLIYKLNQTGILTVQRTCYGCKFHKKVNDTDYCNLLEKELVQKDIRLDCPEFVER